MTTFLLLVMLPIAFFSAIIAIFMYCSHYLLGYAKESVTQIVDQMMNSDDTSKD